MYGICGLTHHLSRRISPSNPLGHNSLRRALFERRLAYFWSEDLGNAVQKFTATLPGNVPRFSCDDTIY